MRYFIIFGKTILVILSPHSINSDIHFVQGLLSLGCQKNIKAGSTRGKYFQMVWTALGPHLHSALLPTQPGRVRDLMRGLETPLQLDKKPTLQGAGVGWGGNRGHLCRNPSGRAVVWAGQWLLPFKQRILSPLSRSHRLVDDCCRCGNPSNPNIKRKEDLGPTPKGEGHTIAHDTRHDFIPCQMFVVM